MYFENFRKLMEDNANLDTRTVIDWEASAYGCPVWDLAFWVTETLVLESKHSTTIKLVPSFLASYRRTAGEKIVTDDFAAKLALLVGSSLNYFVPRGFWDSTEEEVQYWKDRAMQLVRAGLDHDISWITSSEIRALV
jgi:aminoglycoside phosphotransferase (APT) family kinase protein